METQSIILYIIYLIKYFPEKKRLKRQDKARKKETNVYLYTGRQEIISSLVRYVTAHDTHAIRKK